jgi:hypothetical protein
MPEAKVAALIANAKRPFVITFLVPPPVADVESGGAAAPVVPALDDAGSSPSFQKISPRIIDNPSVDIAPALPVHSASVPSGSSTDRPAPHLLLQRLLAGAATAPAPAPRSADGRLGSPNPAQASEANEEHEGGHTRRKSEWSAVKGFLALLASPSVAVAPAASDPSTAAHDPAYPATVDGVSDDTPENAASASEVTQDDALLSSRERIESVMSAAPAAAAPTPAPGMTAAPDTATTETSDLSQNEDDDSIVLAA